MARKISSNQSLRAIIFCISVGGVLLLFFSTQPTLKPHEEIVHRVIHHYNKVAGETVDVNEQQTTDPMQSYDDDKKQNHFHADELYSINQQFDEIEAQNEEFIANVNNVRMNNEKKQKQMNIQQFPNYYEDNLRPEWKFQTARNYEDNLLRYWTDPIENVNISSATGQGENGKGYVAAENETEDIEKLMKEHNYNVWATDRISLRRTLPDYRYPECLNVTYPDKLPTTSVIIIFHNERWATLLRTVWSIIDRSPTELLEEIILVDDASTWESLKRPLDDYLLLLPAPVKIIRTEKREGLIRARLIGAKMAKGSVLTFLDAHIECSKGWLEPILSRISYDRSVVAVPNIDWLHINSMAYYALANIQYTAPRWTLRFYWTTIPERERIRTNYDVTAPVRTPTHVGCAFSMDREFFFELGSYDEGMDIWGSENIELAFRVWMCGGSLEILPCSRVAHLYRTSTYSFNGDREKIMHRNNNRVAEVWMEEYKKHYYARKPEARSVPSGDLTDRFELKTRLQCKSFRWYLETIYPEGILMREYSVMGDIQNEATQKCLDMWGILSGGDSMSLYKCHQEGGNQYFALDKSGLLLTGTDQCLAVRHGKFTLKECREQDKSQLWDWNDNDRWLLHRKSGFCMTFNKTDVVLGTCNSADKRNKWIFRSLV